MIGKTTEQTMTTVEDAHNSADDGRQVAKIAVRSKDRRESIFSKLKQNHSCVNKIDCDTAGSKQKCARRFRTR